MDTKRWSLIVVISVLVTIIGLGITYQLTSQPNTQLAPQDADQATGYLFELNGQYYYVQEGPESVDYTAATIAKIPLNELSRTERELLARLNAKFATNTVKIATNN